MRPALVAIALCLLALGSALPAMAAADTGTHTASEPPAEDDNATASAPGAQLSTTMASQEARVSGTFEASIVETDLASADSPEERARRLARLGEDLQERLASLHAERSRLIERFENGEIDAATFRSRMAALAGRTSTVASLAERAGEEARTIEQPARDAAELDPDRLATVARDGSALRANVSQRLGHASERIPGELLDNRSTPGFETDIDVEELLERTPTPPNVTWTEMPEEPTMPPTPEEPTMPDEGITPPENLTAEFDETHTFSTPEDFEDEYNFTDDGG